MVDTVVVLGEEPAYARSRICPVWAFDLEESPADASARSTLLPGYQVGMQASAQATDALMSDNGVLIEETAGTKSLALGTLSGIASLVDRSVGRDSAFLVYEVSLTGAGVVTDQVERGRQFLTLTERLTARSGLVLGLSAEYEVVSTGRASSSVLVAKHEDLNSAARVLDSLVSTRVVWVDADDSLRAKDDAELGGGKDIEVLLSSGTIISTIDNTYRGTADLGSTGLIVDRLITRDPSLRSLTLTPETGAVSEYVGFDFESIAQVGEDVFAAGPDGLYLLGADTDDGQPIAARVDFAGLGFGLPQTKRIDNFYVGHTGGRLRLGISTQDSGTLSGMWELEPRDASAPRPTRVTPAKGMWGRYWYVTIQNVDGAPFWIDDAEIDLAVSKRRV